MKILLIGAMGFLGRHLARDFSKNNELSCADKYENAEGLHYLDLTKKDLVREVFLEFRPQIVLLPASVTGVDFCEKNQDLVWQVNAEGPKEVAVCAKKHGAFLVFYSSDYVFDGAGGPYSEKDRPAPINFYGRTKLEAERIIQKELRNFLIIRTCSLYGYDKGGLNFAMQVWSGLANTRPCVVPEDQFGTPTYVEDLSRVTFELVRSRKAGIFNVVGPDYVNRVEFAAAIADTFGFDRGLIRGVDTGQLGQAAPRPKKGGLKTDKLRAEAGLETVGLKAGLLAMKERAKP